MIGYAINIGEHAWYQRLVPGLAAVAAQHDVEFAAADAAGDAAQQVAQIHTLLDRGARVLVISPMDPTGLDDVLKRCGSTGVPVITESIRTGDDRVRSHLGINEYNAGVALGTRVGLDLAPRDVVTMLLVGFPPFTEAADREAGFLSGIRRTHEHVETLCAQGGGTTMAAAADVAELLASRPGWSPDVVFGVDDEVLLGGLQALEATGAFPQLTATYGISPPHGPGLLEDGTLSWGVAMLPELHGKILGRLAVAALAGSDIPRRVELDTAIVTSAGHPEGWDRYYTREGEDFVLIDYHANSLLPAGLDLALPGAP